MKRSALICLLLLWTSLAFADSISNPNNFSCETQDAPAKMNESFKILYDQVNKVGGQINIDSTNNRVGIGVSSPSEKLDVYGNVKATKFIGDGSQLTNLPSSGSSGDITGVTAGSGLSGGGESGGVSVSVDTTAIQKRVTGTCDAGSSIREIKADGTVTCETDDEGTGGTSLWSESGSDVYRNSGKVGVGTTSPSKTLDVKGDAVFNYDGGNIGALHIDNGGASGGARIHAYKASGSVGFIFDSDGDSNFAGGNVGIGKSPAAKLDVSGTIRANELCDETGSNCKDISGGWDSGGDASYGSSASSPSDAIYVDDSGNVGIGKISPNAKLEVNGDIISNSIGYDSKSSVKQSLTPYFSQ